MSEQDKTDLKGHKEAPSVAKRPKYENLIETIKELYVENGLPAYKVAEQLGLSDQTVSNWLKRAGIRIASSMERRTPEEAEVIRKKLSAIRTANPTKTKGPQKLSTCEECGESFPYRKLAKYCSRSCRAKVFARERSKRSISDYYRDPVICPCGKPVPYESRSIRLYCSEKCRALYQKKKQENPENWVIFNCETCGEETKRPRRKDRPWKFCSNKCATKWTRKKRHIIVNDSDVVLDSGFEALVWGYFVFRKLLIERFDRAECISFKDGWYGPDFFLPMIDVYIEVKGFEDEDDRERYEAFRATGKKLCVLDRESIELLMKSENPIQFCQEKAF